MPKLPDDPDEQEQAFFLATGHVIREWAELEIFLLWFLTQLLQIDEFRARIIWGNLPNIRARVLLLRRLGGTFVDDSVLPEFTKILDRIEKLAGKRNILAHCLGGVHTETKKVVFVQDQPDPDFGVDFVGERQFDLSNVLNWPDDIIRLRNDMMLTLKMVQRATHALPKMHRKPEESTGEGPSFPPKPSQT
jgi:hypothetical protein